MQPTRIRTQSKEIRLRTDLRVAIHGVTASLVLLTVYFAIVSLAQGFGHAVEEFISLSYLMVPLVVGFGIQFSLFSYARLYAQAIHQGSASVTATGGLSTASVVACCAHHVTDLVPFVGITAAAAFLSAYQTFFIAIGLLSNIVGITIMLAIIQKHHMYNPKGLLGRIMRIDMSKVRNLALVVALIAVIPIGWSASANLQNQGVTAASNTVTLPEKVSDANGLVVTVTPLPLSNGTSVQFGIKMDTHSGDLSFNVTQVAFLTDSNGVNYSPTEWSGSPPGGHHREGTLTFPPLNGNPVSIKLVLKGLYGVDRTFEWNLAG